MPDEDLSTLGAVIKAAYEAEPNAFTDAKNTKLTGIEAGAEVNAVDSVNGATGAVVLDADDISDASTTNKFATAAELSKLAGIEAGATADQTAAEIGALEGVWRGTGAETLLDATLALEAAAAAGASDGDKGDIIVSSSGTVWTVENGAITLAKIATAAKTGADAKLVTGTAGAADRLAKWNADGDLVEAAEVSLSAPAGDRLQGYDLSAGGPAFFELGAGLSISGTTLSATIASLTGNLDGGGNEIANYKNKVVTGVSGALTVAAHSGNVLETSGNVTVPTTAGFTATIIAGGAHTVTFNSTTSAAMAAGDVMTVLVESATVIHAVLTAAADKVSFA